MAELGVLKDARIWMGGYEITGSMNAVSLRHGVDVKDNTVLGLDTRSEAAGLRTVEARASGLYAVNATNVGTYEIDDILTLSLALADVPISFGVETGALGEVGYTFESLETVYEWGAPVGDLPGYDMNATARGTPLVRGTIMHNATESSGSGSETGYQVGAIAEGETMYAVLHALRHIGTDETLDVTIESDDNGSFTSATTRFTFDQATEREYQWLSLDGPITDDYWRVAWTIGGTDSPTYEFVVIVGIF